ncbi:hypothetical protein Q8A73_009635 [Channa argus]|nr:hypothetical protein Q8A73_009635 [Channa argus]
MTAWLLWMVLACLSDGAVAKCSVESVNEGSDFRKVSCPPLMPGPQQLKYLLLFNDSRVAQMQIEMPDSAGGQLSANFDVTASRDGLYVCKMEVTYPPPFKEDCHSFQVKVNRTEKQHVVAISSINSTTPPTTTPTCPGRSSFIPEVVLYAACGVLLVYSLAVTCITIITWVRLKTGSVKVRVIRPHYSNSSPFLCVSEEDEGKQGGHVCVHEHQTRRSQEKLQSLTTIYSSWTESMQLMKLWMFCGDLWVQI